MATREQLIEALRNADAAGDRPAAEQLAAALQKMAPSPPSPSEPLMDGSGGGGSEQPTPEQLHAQQVMSDFEAMPWYQKAGTAATDVARLGLGGATFGFNDKLSHLWGGQDPAAAQQSTQDARTRAGGAGSLIEAMGMMSMPGIAAERMIPQGASAIQKLLGYGSAAAMEGGVAGGLNAAGHDQPIVEGAQSGMMFGPLARLGVEGLARGGSKVAGALNPTRSIPTEAELRAIADINYGKMRKEKINIKQPTTSKLAAKNTQDMRRFELDEIVHPKAVRRTRALNNKLNRPYGISLSRLDAQRSAINRDLPGETAGNQTAGILRKNIDELVGNMGVKDTTFARDPAAAIEALKAGRDFSGRAAKMGEVDTALGSAERATARSKRSDTDAAIRAKIEPLVVQGPLGRSPDEFAQMAEISGGKGVRKAMQQLGRLSPTNWSGMGGVGIGGGVGTGLMMGSPTMAGVLGVGIPAAGYAGKKIADRMTSNMAEDLRATIAAGGTKVKPYTNAVQDALMGGKDKAKRLAQMWAIANSNAGR